MNVRTYQPVASLLALWNNKCEMVADTLSHCLVFKTAAADLLAPTPILAACLSHEIYVRPRCPQMHVSVPSPSTYRAPFQTMRGQQPLWHTAASQLHVQYLHARSPRVTVFPSNGWMGIFFVRFDGAFFTKKARALVLCVRLCGESGLANKSPII